MKQIRKINIHLFIAVLFLIPTFAHASELGFVPKNLPVPQVQNSTITLVLNSENETVNAVEGRVLIKKPLQFSDVSISNSVVTYWVKQPTFNTQTNSIEFSGTVPGGFNGNNGVLFSIVLKPITNSTEINDALLVLDEQVLISDGLGSLAKVTKTNFSFRNDIPSAANDLPNLFTEQSQKDLIAPEVFNPQVVRDDRVFVGKWFVVFSTLDKQSGVDYYELQESRSGSIDSQKWKKVESPYVLEDQELKSFIYITAVDKQGNERIIKVAPKNLLTWQQKYKSAFMVMGVAVVMLIFWLIIRRKQKQSL